MKRPVKIGIGIVAALVVVVAAAVIFLFASLDSLIETAIEDIGSEATQARVELDEAEISPTSGAGALRGLTVGNPKGFKTPSAFKLGEISVKLDIGTVTEDVIVIKEIVITNPQVTYEIGPDGTNIDAIKKNVDDFAGAEKTEAKKSGGGEGPKIIIENLYIRGGKVNVSATALGGKTLSAPLPDLHLTDIGKEEGGTGPGEAIEEVIDALTKGIGKSVATLNLDSVLGVVESGAKGAVGAIEEGVKGVGGVVEEGAKGLGSAVKGLFGGDK
jgi:uncharacterized protein involved in outer membrane biogenesis